jgi:Transmembrane secretion effector
LPNLVSTEELAPANTLTSASWGTMLAIGSAIGGWVAAHLGRDAAFMIDASSFLLSATLIYRIRGNFSAPGTRDHASGTGFREGIAYARSDPRILALLATKGGFGLGVGVVALLPILATDAFRSGDEGIGLLFAARGLGALLGPFVAVGLVGTSIRRLLSALAWAMALYGVIYLFVAGAPVIGVAAALAVVAHMGGGAQWVLSTYGLQKLSPDRVRGRILSMDLGLVSLTIGLSSIAAGRLADAYPPRVVMAGLAVVEIGYAVVWTLATRNVRRHAGDEPVLEEPAELTAIPVEGPV